MCVAALIARLPALAPEARFHLWTHPECPTPVSAPNVTTSVVHAPADGLRTLLMPAHVDPLSSDDVMHFPFSLLGRGLPCASVVTMHDLMWLEQPEKVDARTFMRRVRAGFYQSGMRYALRHASRLIAVSRATADRIHAVSPESSFGAAGAAGAGAWARAESVSSSSVEVASISRCKTRYTDFINFLRETDRRGGEPSPDP